MKKPRLQLILSYIVWILTGLLGFGAFLDAVTNAYDVITLPIAITGSAVVVLGWLGINAYLKRYPAEWLLQGGNLGRISRLNRSLMWPMIGMIILLWIPIFFPNLGRQTTSANQPIVVIMATSTLIPIPTSTSTGTPRPPTNTPTSTNTPIPTPTSIPTPTIPPTATVIPGLEVAGIVTKERTLGIRSGPGFQFDLLTTLPSDSRVTAIARIPIGDWILVRLPHKREAEGWAIGGSTAVKWESDISLLSVHTSIAEIMSTSKSLGVGIVKKGKPLLVRSGPGSQFDLLMTLPPDTLIAPLARSETGDWILVLLPEGTEGWVLAKSRSVEWQTNIGRLPIK